MKTTTSVHRHRATITGIAALGLATTAMLAPAAHADTELDSPGGPAGTAVVADTVGAPGAPGEETAVEAAGEETASGPAAGTGEEVTAEAGDQAPAGDVEEAVEEAVAEAGEAGEQAPAGSIEEAAPDAGDAPLAEEAAPAGSEQDDLCVDGTAGDAQAPETVIAGTDDAALDDATAEEGTDGSAGLHDAAPGGEGTVVDPGCAVTSPDQAGNGPGGQDGGETQLPVGGVDAGKGEAVSQNMVLPIATAGAVAAAVSLGAYTLVRRRRSGA